MRPLFPPGSTLRIHPATVRDVQLGDVVLVELQGQLVAHRLIRRDGRSLVTRGDSMPCADKRLPHEALIGRVEVPRGSLAVCAALRALLRWSG